MQKRTTLCRYHLKEPTCKPEGNYVNMRRALNECHARIMFENSCLESVNKNNISKLWGDVSVIDKKDDI